MPFAAPEWSVIALELGEVLSLTRGAPRSGKGQYINPAECYPAPPMRSIVTILSV